MEGEGPAKMIKTEAETMDIKGFGLPPAWRRAPPMPARQTPNGQPYAGLEKYNTDSGRIFVTSGKIVMDAVDTGKIVTIDLPIAIQQDGTAIVPELMKMRLIYEMFPDPDVGIEQRRQVVSLYLGDNAEARLGGTEDNLLYFEKVQVAEGVEKLIDSWTRVEHQYFATKDTGRIITVKPHLYAYTVNFDAVATFRYHIYYKQRVLSTPAYAGRRIQQGER